MSDRWTPIRDGAVYCSPACGGKCTMEDFEWATKEAEKLARLMGDGWEPHVWENLGWHYRVTNGVAAVHPRKQRNPETGAWEVPGYWANVLCAVGQFNAKATDPLEAYGIAVQDLRSKLDRARAELDAINQ